jgi:hypothetical protein
MWRSAGKSRDQNVKNLTLALLLRRKIGAGGVKALNGEGSLPSLSPIIVRFEPKLAPVKKPI